MTQMTLVSRRPLVWVAVERLPAALALKAASTAEVAQARTMPDWRAAEFLAGRSLLRSLLRRTLGTDSALMDSALMDSAPIEADPLGRPFLAGHPRVGVSISHDDRFVAACVGIGTEVGVDVQTPPDHVEARMMRRVLHGHAARLATAPPRHRAREFAWAWTVQESCVKAQGVGLAGRPWTIDVPPGARSGQWDRYRWVSLRGRSRTPLSCAFALTGKARSREAAA